MGKQPLSIFISYAPKDRPAFKELEKRLALLCKRGIVIIQHAGLVALGESIETYCYNKIQDSDIVILLLSSDYFFDRLTELQRSAAIHRHCDGALRLVPVLVRSVDLQEQHFEKVQLLPRDGKPISSVRNRDQAWSHVAQEIHSLCMSILSDKEEQAASAEEKLTKALRNDNFLYISERFISDLSDEFHVPIRSNRSRSKHIRDLVAVLKKQDILSYKRPLSMVEPDRKHPYVFEKTQATKVSLPFHYIKSTDSITGLIGLSVWISDPPIQDLEKNDENEGNYNGTFLFLVESHWDGGLYNRVLSGVSALRAILHLAKPAIPERSFEPFGRDDAYLHPLEKLRSLQSIVGDKREIITLYKKRYITDEQNYTLMGTQRRGSDLCGYPVFIAEAEMD